MADLQDKQEKELTENVEVEEEAAEETKPEENLAEKEAEKATLADLEERIEQLQREKSISEQKVQSLIEGLGHLLKNLGAEVEAALEAPQEESVQESAPQAEEVEKEDSDLTTQLIEMQSEYHKSLAEQVAQSRIILGKVESSEFESEVSKLLERSIDSLKDTLNDLQSDISERLLENRRVPQKVSNPGVGIAEHDDTLEEDSLRENDQSDELEKLRKLEPKQIIRNLFQGIH